MNKRFVCTFGADTPHSLKVASAEPRLRQDKAREQNCLPLTVLPQRRGQPVRRQTPFKSKQHDVPCWLLKVHT